MINKAMAVLDLFTTSRRELGVVEIAELLGKPRSTVSRQLALMERAGWLDRDGEMGPYRLGIRLAALGELARRSTSLQRAARPYLEVLTRTTRETSSVNVLLGTDVVNASVVESPRPVLLAGGSGIPMPVHATAAGKVLLAWRTKEEVLRILPARLEQFTQETITDVDAFLAQLGAVRARGHALAIGELAEDLLAVSAPVRDSTGGVIAAVTVGGPMGRLPSESHGLLAKRVMTAALGLSHAMGYIDNVDSDPARRAGSSPHGDSDPSKTGGGS
jgi:IclR family transcriptional regulator, KDG regulon repressor